MQAARGRPRTALGGVAVQALADALTPTRKQVTHASSSVLDEVLRLRHDAEQELAAAAAARLQG